MKESRSSVAVPLIATAAWYVVTLAYLVIVNGQLRLKTDVMALAIGAVTVGLPVSVAVTILLGLPAYLLARATIGVNWASAVVSGVGVGLATALVFWVYARDWSFVSPLRGMLIGALTAMVWWRWSRRLAAAGGGRR